MSFKNNTSQKIISALLIISIIAPSVLFSMPKQVKAFGPTQESGPFGFLMGMLTGTGTTANVTNTAITVKGVAKEILKQILMTIARKLLQDMTKSTINWINSGFHGAPLFLENPESFFKDIAKYEIRTMVDMFGYDSNKFPFGKDFALNTISSYKRQLDDNAAYTLNKVMTEPQARQFRNNFNVGGWNGFLINTQYPQNNYLGFQMIATEALAKKLQGTVQNAAQKVQTTLQQGMGFLSPQKCVTNPNYNTLNNQFRPPKFDNDAFQKDNPYDAPEPKDCGSLASAAGNPTAVLAYQQCILKNETDLQKYKADYNAKAAAATASFDEKEGKNSCPNKSDGSSGLEATTPGSVVGSQIMKAITGPYDQTSLAAAMGNSISAVLDTLLNKFLGDGLNALASKVNPKPAPDTWKYDGQSLGSPADGTNTPWDAGPDEPIIIGDFKKKIEGKTEIIAQKGDIIGKNADGENIIAEGGEITKTEIGNIHNCTYDKDLKKWCSTTEYTYIPGDIENTETELKLMDNTSRTSPGITQLLGSIWPKSRELDMCQPGPDLDWKDRMTEEKNRNSLKLQGKTSDSNGNLAAEAQLVYKELQFAVDFFKDWINNKMMTELPDSVLYMDAVDEIKTLSQQSNELADKRRTKTQALARLQSIKTTLNSITKLDLGGKIIQPAVGSDDEKKMISLYKQYKATSDAVSNTTSIDNTINELAIAREKLAKLDILVTQCNAERTANGWSLPGGPTSTKSGKTEKEIYCDEPIKGGYNHESFTHANDATSGLFGAILGGILFAPLSPIGGALIGSKLIRTGGNNPVTYLTIPYVNAKDVLKWRGALGIFGHSASIQISCNAIWKTNILDYKGNLPGATPSNIKDIPLPPDGTNITNSGTCIVHNKNTDTDSIESSVAEEDCRAINEKCIPKNSLGTTEQERQECFTTSWVPEKPSNPLDAPIIAGTQGYNPSTDLYTANQAIAGQYLILYGTFTPSGNIVNVGEQSYTPTYESINQINVLLGSATGIFDVTILNANGTSDSSSITVKNPPSQ